MRSIPPRVLLQLRHFIANQPGYSTERVGWLVALDAALSLKKSAKPAAARRSAKKRTARAEMGAVAEAVHKRAQGRCEACGADVFPLEVDHMRGGRNRRSRQSIEGCWALDRGCHRLKTDNSPSRLHWLSAFREHCLKHQYDREARSVESLIDAVYLNAAAREVLP